MNNTVTNILISSIESIKTNISTILKDISTVAAAIENLKTFEKTHKINLGVDYKEMLINAELQLFFTSAEYNNYIDIKNNYIRSNNLTEKEKDIIEELEEGNLENIKDIEKSCSRIIKTLKR